MELQVPVGLNVVAVTTIGSDDNPAAPSISAPRCLHVLPLKSYTRTCPLSRPFAPKFIGAPTATTVPSADKLTEYPL